MNKTKSSRRRAAAGRMARGALASENHAQLAKNEAAASEAKTARLRALRLAKEAEDAEAARVVSQNAPASSAKRAKRSH